jgi:hypothetical protein
VNKFFLLIAPAVAAVALTACDPSERPEVDQGAAVTYVVPPTTAGDPDGPEIDREPTTQDSPRTSSQASTGEPRAATEDSGGAWDADTRGNNRYDPDSFNCEVDGNGACDPGGVKVNGPNSLWHDGLPCYLDFPDVRTALTSAQYRYAYDRHCEAVNASASW